MKVLGIRMSNSDFTFSVLGGTKEKPQLLVSKTLPLPSDYSPQDKFNWLFLEVKKVIREEKIMGVVIKGAESMVRRSNSLDFRVGLEAIVYLAALKCSVKNITKKVKSTIAKDLGLKGKAKYLSTKLNTELIDNFNNKSSKIQEAALAAWTIL